MYVNNRGYLNFKFGQTLSNDEIDGQNGEAQLGSQQDEIDIGVKPATAGKLYLLDGYVKGHDSEAHCSHCFFYADGPDGHREEWDMTGDWQHLYFTIDTGDTDWYVIKLKGAESFRFTSCNVIEVQ